MEILDNQARGCAKDWAPWADVDPALTISGLISARHTRERQTWARVLSGTDEQLASFIRPWIKLHPANFGCPDEAADALALYLVGSIERVVTNGVPLQEIRDWYNAWAAGMKYQYNATRTMPDPQD